MEDLSYLNAVSVDNPQILPDIHIALNSTINTSPSQTPFKLLYGVEPKRGIRYPAIG